MTTITLKSENGVVAGIPSVPVTVQHAPPLDLDKAVANPGLPRANITCDREHPDGTYSPPNMTVLQQHVAFWDRDNDGVIWPSDTFVGFHRLGFNVIISTLAMLIIHGSFAWWSQDSWIPDPAFRIQVKNIHRTKHGSDSETYDTEGRFVPQKFEEVFSKYDRGNKGGLTFKDINNMIRSTRNINDFAGIFAGWLEWSITYMLIARDTPQGRLITKDDVRGVIDGTLFYKIATEVEQKKIKKKGVAPAGFARKEE